MFKNMILMAVLFIVPVQLTYADYDTFTVNIPNAQGGYTALIIKKSGDGYIGPQGEYYPNFPTVAQLQVMYRLGAPVQVQEQVPEAPQVIDQQPDEDQAQEADVYPAAYPNVVEMPAPASIVEENNTLLLFQLKKKDKSKAQETDHPPTPQHPEPTKLQPVRSQPPSAPTQNKKENSNTDQKSKPAVPVDQPAPGNPGH